MKDKLIYKTGMEVVYANERYEITSIDEYTNKMLLYSEKLKLRVECEINSPHLKAIEQENK